VLEKHPLRIYGYIEYGLMVEVCVLYS